MDLTPCVSVKMLVKTFKIVMRVILLAWKLGQNLKCMVDTFCF